jgi:hypothetical protein
VSIRAAWAVDDFAISIDAGTQSLRSIESATGLRQKLDTARIPDRKLGHDPRPQRAAVLTKLAGWCGADLLQRFAGASRVAPARCNQIAGC